MSPLTVFPTYVGVFPLISARKSFARCLPHVRGGVSWGGLEADKGLLSSPRTWGCFLLRKRSRDHRVVFPTYVGVFPSS